MKSSFADSEIVTKNGKSVSVILPVNDYPEMLERLEDAEAVACLKKARTRALRYRPLEDVLEDFAK